MTPPFSDRAWWASDPACIPPVVSHTVRRESRYLATRDGTRLAADIHLPADLAADRVPAVVSFTPYVRDMQFGVPGAAWLLARTGRAQIEWGRLFASRGIAFLHVEIRGAGASFGRKTSLFAETVAEDGADVLDWVTEQPWCNGSVGATGISALGLTSMMLAAGKHPALRAIAPRFTTFDIFASVHPGGLLQSRFLTDIGAIVRALDSNRLADAMAPRPLRWLVRRLVKGIRPVDDDRDGSLLAAAVAEHADNEAFDLDIAEVRHRDDPMPHSSLGGTLDDQSPFSYLDAIEASGVAVFAVGGWFDGAFQRDMINLFRSTTNPGNRLLLGPWGHGGGYYSSPLVADSRAKSEFDQAGELIRFFDYHLRGIDRGFSSEPAVHYFTMGEERWNAAPTWPPPDSAPQLWHLASDGLLQQSLPADCGARVYSVDPKTTTGASSRYGHIARVPPAVRYGNRSTHDRRLLCFDSGPFAADTLIAGHPLVTLTMACDQPDAALFVYLEDVGPDGRVDPITEGQLLLSQRQESDDPPYVFLGVWRTGRRADAAAVVPGEPMRIRLDLLPTSWRIRAGHRLRVAVAGADAGNFAPVPATGPAPTFTVFSGSGHESTLELPVIAPVT